MVGGRVRGQPGALRLAWDKMVAQGWGCPGAGVRALGQGGVKVGDEVGEGEVVLQRQLCGVGVGYVPETLSSRRPFALARQQSREGWEAGWEPPWPWSVKAQKAVVLCGRVWTGASEKAGGGQAKEGAGWQGWGAGGSHGACVPPQGTAPQKESPS